MVYEVADGLHRLVDTLRVGNATVVVKRYVKIAAHQNFFSGDVDVLHGLLVEIIHVRTSFQLNGIEFTLDNLLTCASLFYNRTRENSIAIISLFTINSCIFHAFFIKEDWFSHNQSAPSSHLSVCSFPLQES